MLVALSAIASIQAAPIKATLEYTTLFLDYVATYPDAIILYKDNNMILHVHSAASHMSEPKARGRAGGHLFLSNKSNNVPNNEAVQTIAQILKHVMYPA